MQITSIEILEIRLPFQMSFGHALAKRRSSTNVGVLVRLKDGAAGYGEGVPRSYVTGETPEGAAKEIAAALSTGWWRRRFASMDDVAEELAARYEKEGPERGGAARCALELALLDAAGKRFGRSCAGLLGGVRTGAVEYSAILPFLPDTQALAAACLKVRQAGARVIKVKVGQSTVDDDRSIAMAGSAIRSPGSLRVDGNCCWTAEQALKLLPPMIERGVEAVEQPLPAGDLDGLAKVTAAIGAPLIADESLHTLAHARELVERRACAVFNIRISKCGGLLTSQRILKFARHHGIGCQLGAHVGESGILSAAGRAFACAFPDLIYREGSAGRYLLREDITNEDTTMGPMCFAPALPGPGFGVTVDEKRFSQCARNVASWT